MINDDQESIVYKKNGNIISKVTSDDIKGLSLYVIQCMSQQPYIKTGECLVIPVSGKVLTSTPVQMVKKEGNTVSCITKNSTYDIEFNMDLEKIMKRS